MSSKVLLTSSEISAEFSWSSQRCRCQSYQMILSALVRSWFSSRWQASGVQQSRRHARYQHLDFFRRWSKNEWHLNSVINYPELFTSLTSPSSFISSTSDIFLQCNLKTEDWIENDYDENIKIFTVSGALPELFFGEKAKLLAPAEIQVFVLIISYWKIIRIVSNYTFHGFDAWADCTSAISDRVRYTSFIAMSRFLMKNSIADFITRKDGKKR